MSDIPALKRLNDSVKEFADELDNKISDLYTTSEKLKVIRQEILQLIKEEE